MLKTKFDPFTEVLKSSPIVVFAITGCPYCNAVIELFNRKKYVFLVVYMDNIKIIYRTDFQKRLLELTGRTSLPAVFSGGIYIGGCNDGGKERSGMITLDASNKLDIIIIRTSNGLPQKKLPFNLY